MQIRISQALILALAVLLAACDQTTSIPEPPHSPDLPVLSTLPDFNLTDENGDAVTLDAFSGKLWIADFIFTRCPTTCPIQTAQMKQLQTRLQAYPQWSDTRLVSFSVDPEYDVPKILKEYGNAAGAEAGQWKFITGTREAIWKLSIDGFKLAAGESAEGDGPLFHSTKFVLVDARGRIRGYYDGLTNEGVDTLARDVELHAPELLAVRRK